MEKYLPEALVVTDPDHCNEQYEHYPINSCTFPCSYQMLHTKDTKMISYNIMVFFMDLRSQMHICIFSKLLNLSKVNLPQQLTVSLGSRTWLSVISFRAHTGATQDTTNQHHCQEQRKVTGAM